MNSEANEQENEINLVTRFVKLVCERLKCEPTSSADILSVRPEICELFQTKVKLGDTILKYSKRIEHRLSLELIERLMEEG